MDSRHIISMVSRDKIAAAAIEILILPIYSCNAKDCSISDLIRATALTSKTNDFLWKHSQIGSSGHVHGEQLYYRNDINYFFVSNSMQRTEFCIRTE